MMKPRLLFMAAILAAGVPMPSAGGDMEAFIDQLSLPYEQSVKGKKETADHRCRVIARACALGCVNAYQEKNKQALCFKERRCAENMEKCIAENTRKDSPATSCEMLNNHAVSDKLP